MSKTVEVSAESLKVLPHPSDPNKVLVEVEIESEGVFTTQVQDYIVEEDYMKHLGCSEAFEHLYKAFDDDDIIKRVEYELDCKVLVDDSSEIGDIISEVDQIESRVDDLDEDSDIDKFKSEVGIFIRDLQKQLEALRHP